MRIVVGSADWSDGRLPEIIYRKCSCFVNTNFTFYMFERVYIVPLKTRINITSSENNIYLSSNVAYYFLYNCLNWVKYVIYVNI